MPQLEAFAAIYDFGNGKIHLKTGMVGPDDKLPVFVNASLVKTYRGDYNTVMRDAEAEMRRRREGHEPGEKTYRVNLTFYQ